METLNKIKEQIKDFPISKIKGGFRVNFISKKPSLLSFQLEVEKLIFPLREGEFIKNISRLPLNKEYSLSYPGTASIKSIVLFTSQNEGVFIGGKPTYEFAKIRIKRIQKNKIVISYDSPEHNLSFISFRKNWRNGAKKYKKLIGIDSKQSIKRKPKYFLQIGVKDSYKKCWIKSFNDLKPIIDYFHSQLGPGNFIHFFGTNSDGFDRMLPDFTISPELGGKKSLSELINYAREKGLITSHHYNPRIADINWIKQNPKYRNAIVRDQQGEEIIERYKDHIHYVMNPNNKKWFKCCMETVDYLKSIGFDYIQLDQFTYQRNFYNPKKPIQLGYKKMIEEFEKRKIKFWLEGVSDIHRIKEGNFYQILIRDKTRLWEDNENRRGYPYGVSYPFFFMYFYPDSEVSYQLITERNNLYNFEKRIKIAKKIHTTVYDLQMSFYNEKYISLLRKVIEKIKKYDK